METYCNGKHECQICGDIFPCEGIPYGHNSNDTQAYCHGQYSQFCPNHSIGEYKIQHVRNGEL